MSFNVGHRSSSNIAYMCDQLELQHSQHTADVIWPPISKLLCSSEFGLHLKQQPPILLLALAGLGCVLACWHGWGVLKLKRICNERHLVWLYVAQWQAAEQSTVAIQPLMLTFHWSVIKAVVKAKDGHCTIHIIIFAGLFLFPNVNVYFVSSSGNIH